MGPDIVKYIKLKRLQWAGHVVRMDNSRIPKYWMENSMAEDLWEERDWDGKATSRGTPCCCWIKEDGGDWRGTAISAWCRTTEEEKVWCYRNIMRRQQAEVIKQTYDRKCSKRWTRVRPNRNRDNWYKAAVNLMSV